MARRLTARRSPDPGDTLFWAGSPKNTQIRVFSMAEGSNQYSSRDIDIDSWPNGTIKLNAPDGTDNFSFGWPGNAITGATRRTNSEVWFAWNTSSNSNFKNAHIEVVEINTSNFSKIAQWQIWNDAYGFADPYLATNGNGEVGVALAWGGADSNPSNYISHAVGTQAISSYGILNSAPHRLSRRKYDWAITSASRATPPTHCCTMRAAMMCEQPAPATGWYLIPITSKSPGIHSLMAVRQASIDSAAAGFMRPEVAKSRSI